MKKIFFLFVTSLFIACQAQQNDKKPENAVPKGKWQVHKKFDENGNLIAYDSVYTYSSFDSKYASQNIDSIMRQFQQHFSKIEGLPWKNSFSFYPDIDSTFSQSFRDSEFFSRAWKEQNMDLERMLRQMDSVRELFLRDFYKAPAKNQSKSPQHKL